MLASANTSLACLLPAALAFSTGFPYGAQKVRGVSVGGWLLTEVRMPSSSLFRSFFSLCVLTLSMNRRLGSCKTEITAQQKLKAHWDKWITGADFADIAAAGYVCAGYEG